MADKKTSTTKIPDAVKNPPTKKAEVQATPTVTDVAALCEAIGVYSKALEAAEIGSMRLAPQSEADMAALEERLAITLPVDVREFLRHGLQSPKGSLTEGKKFASIGFEWLSVEQSIEHTEMLRTIAASSDDRHAAQINKGVALTHEEPMIVVSSDGVYHFSFRNRLLRICGTFGEFLAAWLAAGCFSSHSFALVERALAAYLPTSIPVEENVWVRAYRRQFGRQ